MIVVDCASCSRRQLLPLGRVLALVTYSIDGQVVHRLDYCCWCDCLGSEYIVGASETMGAWSET